MGCLYLKGKTSKIVPNKNIIFNIGNLPSNLLHLIGYVKIKDFAVDLMFIEKIASNIFSKKRNIFYFDNNILSKYKISKIILYDILEYLDLFKIAGAFDISYWKKKKNLEKKIYNRYSPFYVLKKLQ